MSGYLEKPRVRIKAISQFVALPLCDETAVAQAPPRPAPSATAVSVSESALEPARAADAPTGLNTSDPSVPVGVNNSPITKEQFDDLNRRAT